MNVSQQYNTTHKLLLATCGLLCVIVRCKLELNRASYTQVLFRTQCCPGSYLWRTTAGSCYHLDIANYCASDSVLSCIRETLILRLS